MPFKGLFTPSVSVVVIVAARIANCKDCIDLNSTIHTERHHYGAFTVPDTETGTETETDIETNTLTQNSVGICVSVRIHAV